MEPSDKVSSSTPRSRKAWVPILAVIWLCAIYGRCGYPASLLWPKVRASPLLKVMSFNLRYDNDADKKHGYGWDKRLPAIVDQIMKHQPEIIGTQEGLLHQLHQLKQALAQIGMNYSSCGSPRDRFLGCVPCGEHCAIFSRSSLEAVMQSTFALSETPSCIGSRSWGSGCPRIATYAWFRLDEVQTTGNSDSAQCVLFLNTHLDHVSSRARRLGSELIIHVLDELEKIPPVTCEHLATIVAGDFNSLQRNSRGVPEPPFAVFRSFGFRDACSEFGARDSPFSTFHGYKPASALHAKCPSTFRHGMIHGHIDWILWRGPLKLLDFQVDTTLKDGLPPSDHFPIIATFGVQNQKKNAERPNVLKLSIFLYLFAAQNIDFISIYQWLDLSLHCRRNSHLRPTPFYSCIQWSSKIRSWCCGATLSTAMMHWISGIISG